VNSAEAASKGGVMSHDLVDRLLGQTGLHVGTSTETREDAAPQAARILVTALPGRSGVTFDYEGLNLLTTPERPFGHAERAVLARTVTGLTLYSASIHAPLLMELPETEAGSFEASAGTSPFPLTIQIEVPSAGRLLYTWSFGEPGGELSVRIVGDVSRVD
jgi:hypothetical protein